MKTAMLFLLLGMMATSQAQNYIGMHKDSIEMVIRKTARNFKPDDFAVKKVFNYIKYVDGISQQTLIFFLDEKDICTHSKLMSDYMNYTETVEKFDRQYKKTGSKSWEYIDKGKTYSVVITEGDWYFTVTIREK